MIKRHSLNKQFAYTFLLIILCSLLTILIEVVVLSIYIIQDSKILPANHFEKIVPKIEKVISDNEEKVVDAAFEEVIKGITPREGIKYIVLNDKGKYLYGNTGTDIFPKGEVLEKEWIKRLNTKDVIRNVVTKYIPIMDDNNNLIGEFVLQYKLKVTYKDKGIKDILWGILLSPFIIVAVFTVIFGRQLSKNIKEPLGILTEAAEKIKSNNLDFNINYPYKNELGDVVSSFEEMRAELHKTLNKQWKLEGEKNLMIAAISHDIRTPLTIIKGHAEMLNDGAYKREDRLLKYLRSIENSSDRAVALLNDMNTLIKLENADFNLNKEKVHIYSFIEEKAKEYEPLTQLKNIKIKIEFWIDGNLKKVGDEREIGIRERVGVEKHKIKIEGEIQQDVKGDKLNMKNEVRLEREVKVDRVRISQVIDNIITNSIRYTPDGGIINIRINIVKDVLEIAVEDSGEGFTDEDLKMATEKFYRGDKSRGSGTGQSGLGLYISRKLINLHGGELKIYNNKNSGAGVKFYL